MPMLKSEKDVLALCLSFLTLLHSESKIMDHSGAIPMASMHGDLLKADQAGGSICKSPSLELGI